MGQGTQAKTQRNLELKADYLKTHSNGVYVFSLEDLQRKYDLTNQRIYAILRSLGIHSKRGGIQYYNKKIRKTKKGQENV